MAGTFEPFWSCLLWTRAGEQAARTASDLFSLGVDCRDAAALQVPSYSSLPVLKELTHADACADSSSVADTSELSVLAHPAPRLLVALPTQPPLMLDWRLLHTSKSSKPRLGE